MSRFGPFLLDRSGYRLLHGTEPLTLTPQLLDLLIYLVDRAGSLVTKDELLNALWPNANVTENAVAHAVSDLRQVLGDNASAPVFIKTVARRGYRFIATAENVQAAAQPTTKPRDAERHESDVPAVAVLDFVNVTDDADASWLSAGIAETLAIGLRATPSWRVIDRSRVLETARRTNGALQHIAAELDAQRVVLGNYQRHGPYLRVTARLVDVASGQTLADAKVDGPFDKVFELQDELVNRMLTNAGAPTLPNSTSPSGRRDTPSLVAYRAYVEGWLRVEALDVRELPTAIDKFRDAIQADPGYPLAYAGLASAELALYESTRTATRPDRERLERAIAHGRKAVQLEDHLAEAHATLALVLVSAWQTNEAAHAARRAVALEPANWRHLFRLGHATWGDERLRAASRTLALYPEFAYAHFQTAMVHVARGQLAEAEAVLRHGAAVQDHQIGRGERYPALGLHWLLGLVRLAQHAPDDAVQEFDRELADADEHRLYGREYAVEAHYGRGSALLDMQRTEQATHAFRQALEIDADHVPARLALGTSLRGDREHPAVDPELAQVDEILSVMASIRPIDAALMRARALVALSRPAEAVQQLEQLLADAPPGFAGWVIPIDPLFRPVLGHEPFARVLARLATRAI